eukprot:TRINITY_DN23727_c0_g1_i1.p1 TRINITY_DN23727_c0_g1~~TRINITY_DN23727_c0_g1_i1.p1  ORF type:complete len:682 (+),score=86.18 TRINITY_DN23727_c0_g1_i1:61-2046(+)
MAISGLPAEAAVTGALVALYREGLEPKMHAVQWMVERLFSQSITRGELWKLARCTPGLRVNGGCCRSALIELEEPPADVEAFQLPLSMDAWSPLESLESEAYTTLRASEGNWPLANVPEHQSLEIAAWLRDTSAAFTSQPLAVLHALVLSSKKMGILGTSGNRLVLFRDSDAYQRLQNVRHHRPTGVYDGERYVADLEVLKKCLSFLLAQLRCDTRLSVSRLKDLFRQHFEAELSETAFGAATLVELLSKPEITEDFEILRKEDTAEAFIMPRRELVKGWQPCYRLKALKHSMMTWSGSRSLSSDGLHDPAKQQEKQMSMADFGPSQIPRSMKGTSLNKVTLDQEFGNLQSANGLHAITNPLASGSVRARHAPSRAVRSDVARKPRSGREKKSKPKVVSPRNYFCHGQSASVVEPPFSGPVSEPVTGPCASEKLERPQVCRQPCEIEPGMPLDISAVPRPLKPRETWWPERETTSTFPDRQSKSTAALSRSSSKHNQTSEGADAPFAISTPSRRITAALPGSSSKQSQSSADAFVPCNDSDPARKNTAALPCSSSQRSQSIADADAHCIILGPACKNTATLPGSSSECSESGTNCGVLLDSESEDTTLHVANSSLLDRAPHQLPAWCVVRRTFIDVSDVFRVVPQGVRSHTVPPPSENADP